MATERAFLGVAALLFAASVVATIAWCTSMSAMGGMPMPGGWSMSMTWMRMPGQTWPGAAASFLGMWIVTTVAMMLPAVVPVLRRYREVIGLTTGPRLGLLTTVIGAGYLVVWTTFGAAVYPVGAALAALAMQQPALSRAVPPAVGTVVLIAGALQFTGWKARRLACCRDAPGHAGALPRDAGSAWRLGLRLGVQCAWCCGNLMLILLLLGVMDLAAMTAVTAAIALERIEPSGQRVTRAVGLVAVAAGMLLIGRAAAFV